MRFCLCFRAVYGIISLNRQEKFTYVIEIKGGGE